jgi:hypothetical protein
MIPVDKETKDRFNEKRKNTIYGQVGMKQYLNYLMNKEEELQELNKLVEQK